jgi:photosystem II stability/assembly factor-like uncharacterized protein
MRIIKNIIFLIVFLGSVLHSQTPKLIGPPGGTVFNIGLHRNYPNVLYSSTEIGGDFRSTDGGMTVKPVGLVGGTSYYFYPAPSDTTFLFLITYPGGMLLKSTNAGNNFSFVEINSDSSNNTHLQFNPYNSQEIYLIRKEKQLWKSNNGGTSWYNLITFDTSLVSRVAIASTDTSIIYVTAADRIYRSTNSGLNWELRGHIPGIMGGIVQLEVNPQNKNTIYLQGGSFPKFFKSMDGGKTFSIQSEIFLYDFALNPNDSNIVYCASEYGLFKSTDEGKNWVGLYNGLPSGSFGSRTIEINLDNPDEIYAGVGGSGVFKSSDAGNTWFQSNLAYCDVSNYDFISNAAEHLMATQYPWFIKTTTDDGENWFIPNFDPPYNNINGYSYFDTNPSNKDEAYLTDYVKTYKTIDAGLNWQQTNPFTNSTALWYNKFNSNIIFGSDGVNTWRTIDNGANWEMISEIIPGYYVFDPQNDSTIYAYSVVIHLLKSTDMGSTWQLKTNGLIQPGTGNPASVRGVAVRKDNPDILYCVQGFDGGISKSTDGGENWFQIDSSFRTLKTTMSVSSIYLDENKPGRFYVSTNGNGSFTNDYSWGGLFLTENDGLTWRRLFTGRVTDLKADNSNPKNIYFNTYFGIMKIPDTLTTDIREEQNLIPKDFVLFQNYPNPFNPNTEISWQSPVGGWQTIKIFDILGREITTLVNEYRPVGKYEVNWNAANLPSGVYFYKLQTGNFVETKKMLLLK